MFYFSCGSAAQKRWQLPAVRCDDAELGGQEPQSGFACNEKDVLDAPIGLEQAQNGLSVDRTTRARHAHGDDGSSSFGHRFESNSEFTQFVHQGVYPGTSSSPARARLELRGARAKEKQVRNQRARA